MKEFIIKTFYCVTTTEKSFKVSKVLKGFHATERFLILTDSRGEIMLKPSEQLGTFTAQRGFFTVLTFMFYD